MDNDQALVLLDDFIEEASAALTMGVWARAFVQEGGEPTWDAVKDVSRVARKLAVLAARVSKLEDIYEDILP